MRHQVGRKKKVAEDFYGTRSSYVIKRFKNGDKNQFNAKDVGMTKSKAAN